jgi:nitroreductase
MNAIECIRTRMSIRKSKPGPVPQETLISVIDTAKWSPSYKNSQPWETIIISGGKREELTKLLMELFEKGVKPSPDIPYLAGYYRRSMTKLMISFSLLSSETLVNFMPAVYTGIMSPAESF